LSEDGDMTGCKRASDDKKYILSAAQTSAIPPDRA
jgi:hypothetical protein